LVLISLHLRLIFFELLVVVIVVVATAVGHEENR